MAYPEWFHELAQKVNNWGRWGEDDQIGTINLVTSDVVRKGVASVKDGRRLSLALPLSDAEGVQTGAIPGRINPLRTMLCVNAAMTGDPSDFCTSDDVVTMGLQAGTHWDGLGHVSYAGRMWNGYPADQSITVYGALRCGIHHIRTLLGRGVLLDVPRAKGQDALDPGYPVTYDDLSAAEELAKVKVEPGDIVLVRTGQMRFLRADPPDKIGYGTPAPGLTAGAAPWFRERDVAAVATDTLVFEVWPCEDMSAILPVHLLHLVEMGMTQGQNWVLDELAEDCASDGRYAFLLDASPLPFTNAVGAPVNPVVVK